jgi:hypothetical protein
MRIFQPGCQMFKGEHKSAQARLGAADCGEYRQAAALCCGGSQMTKYMLDTNIFNRVLDGDIPVVDFQDLHVFATHVQLDELNATKDTARAAALLNVLGSLR